MLFGEGLGINAQNIKKISPDGYEIIKAMAVDEWGTDHSMVLYEINNQCNAAIEMITILFDKGDLMLFAEAVIAWSIKSTDVQNMNIIIAWTDGADMSSIFTLFVDWSMVSYEYKKQISAAKSY